MKSIAKRCLSALLVLRSHISLIYAAPALDDFIGFPHRCNLVGTSAAGHDRLAWVEKQRGVVNLWVADELSGWVPRRLTDFSSDSGADTLDFLQFTPDASTIVFAFGIVADVNPNHLATLPVAATYAVSFAGGPVARVANLSACALSGDGLGILYVEHGGKSGASASLWQRSLLAGEADEAVHLFSVKQGSISDVAWNPDRDVMAFSNDRGDHGFVGLYSLASAAVVWAAASVDTDTQPAWSPDGRSLAWVRAMVPARNVGFSPFDGNVGNRGPNFGILVAEVSVNAFSTPSVGHVREVFRDEKYGMLNFGFGERPLLWINTTAVLFGTEAISSWGHAVVLDTTANDSAAIEIRPGSCEDMSWALSEYGWLYLVNNCLQTDGASVERIRVSNMSRETMIHDTLSLPIAGMSSSGYGVAVLSGHIAVLGASYNTPIGVYVKRWVEKNLRPITKNHAFDGHRFVRPKLINFTSSDRRFTLHAQLFLPEASVQQASSGKMPGIVYTHGGSERQMYAAFHYDSCYAQEYAANQWLTMRGAAVLSVNYRSGTGYGHSFRVCEDCMARGAAEYLDVRQAALQLRRTEGVAADRLGIWGLSYGGLNAEQACARDSGLFKVCVAIAGMFNWVSAGRYFTDTGGAVYDADLQPLLPGGFRTLRTGPGPAWAGPGWLDRVQDLQALMLESSPAGHVENLTSPMLLIHGDADEEVAFQETVGAVRAVRALGRNNVQALAFPDEAHGLAAYSHQLQSLQAMGDFLFDHLRGDEGLPVWV